MSVRRAFTLIELLVICAILATMTAIGVGSILSGQGAARVKGATRDVYAAIRHARSVALVTGQRVLVSYSNEKDDDEVSVKIEVVAAKIMKAASDGVKPQPYYVMDYKDVSGQQAGRELVHIRGSKAKPVMSAGKTEGETELPSSESGGDAIEDILFSPMDASVVKGMRVKVLKGDEALKDETAVQAKSRISVFSNVDYLKSRYQEAKAAAKAKEEDKGQTSGGDAASSSSGSVNDMDEAVSVVWETNGAVEPHRVWIYPDGKRPEDGLMLNVDQFGAIKVMDGDGREED